MMVRRQVTMCVAIPVQVTMIVEANLNDDGDYDSDPEWEIVHAELGAHQSMSADQARESMTEEDFRELDRLANEEEDL